MWGPAVFTRTKPASPLPAQTTPLGAEVEHLFYSEFVSHDRAVAQLEAMAGSRTDRLAAAAGSILGSYLSRPGSTHPQAVYSVALLVLAGADVEHVVEHVDRARRKSQDGYSRR